MEQVASITDELQYVYYLSVPNVDHELFRYRSVQETGLLCPDALAEGGFGECLTIPSLFVETGDGPWQSELSSHAGDSKPCRFCDMGGSVKERSSDTGFLAIMRVRVSLFQETRRNQSDCFLQPGVQRTPHNTINHIQADLALATKPRKGAEIERNQQGSGVIDSLARTVIEELVQQGKALFEEKNTAGKRMHTNAEIEHVLVALRKERLGGDVRIFMNPLLVDPGASRSNHIAASTHL